MPEFAAPLETPRSCVSGFFLREMKKTAAETAKRVEVGFYKIAAFLRLSFSPR